MAKKPARSIWEPTEYITVIGESEYTLTPQPISRVLEFDSLLSQVGGMFDALGKSFDVYTKDKKDPQFAGNFETKAEADAFVEDAAGEIEYEVRAVGIEPRDFLAQLTEGPYLVMKPLIPDLELADVQAAPMPQIEYIIGLLVDINGMKWFEGMVKNFLEPLLPTVLQATAGALQSGLPKSTNKDK